MCHLDLRTNPFPSAILLSHVHTPKILIEAIKGVLSKEANEVAKLWHQMSSAIRHFEWIRLQWQYLFYVVLLRLINLPPVSKSNNWPFLLLNEDKWLV